MARLTDVSVRNQKPNSARLEIPDDGQRGLYLIVQPSGRKSYAVRYRFGKETRKLTLQAGISLAAARKFAATAMHDVAEGRDPAVAKQAAKEREANAAKHTLRGVIAEYLASPEARKLKTAYERERLMERLVYTAGIASRPVDAVTRRDLIDLLDEIEHTNGARSADHVLGVLRRILKRHALRNDSYNSPIVAGMGDRYRYSEHARSRTLSDDELRKVWNAAGELGTYGAMCRFLLLTTARLREAARMTWNEVDSDGTWELPGSRSKTGKPVIRPLSRTAQDLLATLPRIGPYVFSLDGEHAFSGFSRWKKRLDDACGVRGWVVHDLRRTSRSLLSRAGINTDHAEMILGHVLPSMRRTYDRHSYFNEKARGLETLAALLHRIIDPKPNVVALGG